MPIELTWAVVKVIFYIIGVAACLMLYRGIPNGGGQNLQRLALGLATGSFAIFSGFHLAQVLGVMPHWSIKLGAYAVGQSAMIVFIFRLWLKDQEKRCNRKSSHSSAHSQIS